MSRALAKARVDRERWEDCYSRSGRMCPTTRWRSRDRRRRGAPAIRWRFACSELFLRECRVVLTDVLHTSSWENRKPVLLLERAAHSYWELSLRFVHALFVLPCWFCTPVFGSFYGFHILAAYGSSHSFSRFKIRFKFNNDESGVSELFDSARE